jgi:hypothetical protein
MQIGLKGATTTIEHSRGAVAKNIWRMFRLADTSSGANIILKWSETRKILRWSEATIILKWKFSQARIILKWSEAKIILKNVGGCFLGQGCCTTGVGKKFRVFRLD